MYSDGKVINAQADWTLEGDYGFEMLYRVNFERANFIFNGSGLKVNLNDAPGFSPEISPEMGYYLELKYFVETLLAGQSVTTATPASTNNFST
ncbi:hypothetical protein D3C84_1127840 [compost metagenome]